MSSNEMDCLEEQQVDGFAPIINSSATDTARSATSSPTVSLQPTTGTQTLKRKAIPPRSDVWNHFLKFKTATGEEKCKCKYCGKEYAANSKHNGTSSARAHISKCEKSPEVKSNQSILVGNNDGEGKLGCWKYDEDVIRKALSFMVIVDELPFKFVENEGFKHFMSMVCPRFRIPSRFTIARDCFSIFNDEKSKLKDLFKRTCQRVALTTDTWTSIQRVNYLVLTAHYVDENWILRKKILSFCPITSHKGNDIGMLIETCLRDWELYRISSITVDNASSNDVAIEYLRRQILNWKGGIAGGQFLHMRCVAHIVNLIVSDGLKEFNQCVVRVRDAVRFIRQSPARLDKFKKCVEVEGIESKALLCLDVCTRWNSTYLMLETAQKFQNAFDRFGRQDPVYMVELDSNHGVPSDEDWNNVRALVCFLENFYELTCRVSGSLYVTANKFFLEICEVEGMLQQWKSHEHKTFSSMAVKMKAKFDKYWGNPEKINILIFIAVILDPQYKLAYIEFALTEMYNDNVCGLQLKKKIKDVLYDLFDEYKVVQPASGESNVRSEETHELEGQRKKRYTITEARLKKFELLAGSVEHKSELEKYLSEPREAVSSNFHVLNWWKLNYHRFPVVSAMARDILATPISTVASESAFSLCGRVLDPFRSSLTPNTVETLVCSQDWLRNTQVLNVEEDLDMLATIEGEIATLNISI